MRVIVAVDLMGQNVVRLVKGDPANKVVYSTDPVSKAISWQAEGAEMLHVVDLDAAFQRGTNREIIINILSSVKVPVQVAGGIRSPDEVEELLSKNAAKVVLGTMAYSSSEPDTVRKLAKKYPGRIVVSIDHKNGQVMVKGWTELAGITLHDAISRFRSIGVSEFLITSIERDGTLAGPDTNTISEAAMSGAKIIASGGVSRIEDVIRLKNAGSSSIILGKALYDGAISIDKARAVA